MLKFASSRVDSPTKLFFPKPENLLRLDRLFHLPERRDERTRLAQRFTRTVAALRIGHICKTTRWKRLDRSLQQLPGILNPADDHHLLDLGVSDGITTLEAVQFLHEHGFAKITAIGIDLHNELVQYDGGLLNEYRSNTGDPVLVQVGPVLLTLGEGASPRQPISRWIAETYLRRWPLREQMKVTSRIPLINPMARECSEISFEVHDLFEARGEWVDRFSLVRAANVLHREYFSDAAILRGLDRLFAYLREGGILQVSRNMAPRESSAMEEHGSFWAKERDRFKTVAEVGRGSCIAELINEFRASEASRRGDTSNQTTKQTDGTGATRRMRSK